MVNILKFHHRCSRVFSSSKSQYIKRREHHQLLLSKRPLQLSTAEHSFYTLLHLTLVLLTNPKSYRTAYSSSVMVVAINF